MNGVYLLYLYGITIGNENIELNLKAEYLFGIDYVDHKMIYLIRILVLILI